MEKKITERQEILFEMKKKKPYRAFLAACMWAGFGLYYTGKPVIASILTNLYLVQSFRGCSDLI